MKKRGGGRREMLKRVRRFQEFKRCDEMVETWKQEKNKEYSHGNKVQGFEK